MKFLHQQFGLVPLLCLSFLLTACGGESEKPRRQIAAPTPQEKSVEVIPEEADVEEPHRNELRVALLLPLSGLNESVGQSMHKAVTMALFASYDPRIKLYPLDTEGTVAGARVAAERAKLKDADIVLGPLLGQNLIAVGETLEGEDIPIIGFSSDANKAARGRYVMGFLPETEVARVTRFAVDSGLTKFAALIPEGAYGRRVQETFGDVIFDSGGSMLAVESYPRDPDRLQESVKTLADYDKRRRHRRDEIRFLKGLRDPVSDEIAKNLEGKEVLEDPEYQAVLVPEGGSLLKSLAPLLPYYEVDPAKIKLLGTGLWNDESLLGEPPLQQGWFAGTDPARLTDFQKAYLDLFGSDPVRIATLGYDAFNLVAALYRTYAVEGQPFVMTAEMIENADGFTGLDGIFRFLPDGTIERGLAILEVDNQQLKVVDPAPKAFPKFGFGVRQATSVTEN